MTVTDYADSLANLMAEDGNEVNGLDLLDYLAILGLTLVESATNEASQAYIQALTERGPA